MSALLLNGHEFSIERSMIDASVMSAPDPNWKQVDRNGHVHVWHFDAEGRASTPTLKFVRTGSWFSEDGEEYPEGHRVCLLCEELVVPEVRVERRSVPGITRYRIDGQDVRKEEFERRYKEAGGR